ncbi:LysR family transcriptional regulator [Undibacterium parvum]|uniref:LysR family transcriptional regulator n=1 Tax=Undibacterium parvum TaxID=401471 RepID=A0A3S9HP90_9BURK|nr:LysR family transcriptional regulator [Undibacterium parvum]AZP13933.1 LysR family transcriptional regulator [Undibacterium parvum]
MRRKIPNTWTLMAFEAAARHQSFTKAASELALTQSAVCRQVAGLEEFLGVQLFLRSKRGVVLTEAGLTYSRQVAVRLNSVERDTLEMMARRGQGGSLEIAVVPSFATRWLLPRLASFQRDYPDITVNLATRTRAFLFNDTEFDAAIHCGKSAWPGVSAHDLLPENLVAVCSPALIAPSTYLRPEQVQKYPLLQQSTRPYAWREWFGSLGLSVEHDMTGCRYELFSMLSQAAIHGMGIALIPPFLIEDELKAGLLTVAVPHAFLSGNSYQLLCPEARSESAALKQFREWLLLQAASYRESHLIST